MMSALAPGQTFEKLVPGSTVGYFGRVETAVLPNIRRLQSARAGAGASKLKLLRRQY